MGKIKVLILEDKILFRNKLREEIENTQLAKVIHISSNAELALDWLSFNDADIVFIKTDYNSSDYLTVIKAIKELNRNINIVIISDSSEESMKKTFCALDNGAIDFIKAESINNSSARDILKSLFSVIKLTEKVGDFKEKNIQSFKSAAIQKSENTNFKYPSLLVVASSTGGPVALEYLFMNLKTNHRTPILVVQHMPPEFTKTLAASLSKKTGHDIVEAKHGQKIEGGKVYIAPGGYHMLLIKEPSGIFLQTEKTDYVNGVRPSADVLFNSIALELANAKILSVILTGMGSDGTDGLKELNKKCQTYTLCQDEDSCVVFGMPKSVINANLANEVLSLTSLPQRINGII